jgi:CheY-like chemotaxis protein
VLVLDDEPLVARSLARALQATHEVTTLTSAAEALRRAREGESWVVVLCVVMMPEMTAMELEAALARERPDLVERVLYVTGGAFTERSREFLASRPHVEKPVDFATLRAAVAARAKRTAAG